MKMKKRFLYIIWIIAFATLPFFSVSAQEWNKECVKDGTSYPHEWNQMFYSKPNTDFPQTCEQVWLQFSCNDWVFVWDFNKYPFESCVDWEAMACNIWNTIIDHGDTIAAYSEQQVQYPKTCEQVSTMLSCNNWNIVWNRQVFKYLWCEEIGWLVDWVDLVLNIKSAGWDKIAQYSSPALQATIKNMWKNIAVGANLKKWFLTCNWKMKDGSKLIIYQSETIKELTINPGTSITQSLLLKDLFTQSLWDKEVECELAAFNWEINIDNNKRTQTFSVEDAKRFDIAMNRAIDSIKDNIDAPEVLIWAEGVKDFIINKVMNVLVPLIITLGILIALLGFYKLLFSSDEKAIGDWVKYITYWLMWIIVIMSAKFISNTLYSDIFATWDLWYWDIQGHEIAQKIYEKIAFPFIKMAIYLSLGVLFVVLAARTITFIFADSSETKKKAGTIIARNVIWMFVIIAAKQAVEFIYGRQSDVVKNVSNLWEIGGWILSNKNLPILYEIINWAMGLAALVILIMVLVQAFQLLLKPDSPDSMKKIKNSLLYIFIWIIIIGAGYIITNFLIIN